MHNYISSFIIKWEWKKMNEKEWLGENNQLGTDIWRKKYCFENESFEEWITRISGGNADIARLMKEKKF